MKQKKKKQLEKNKPLGAEGFLRLLGCQAVASQPWQQTKLF